VAPARPPLVPEALWRRACRSCHYASVDLHTGRARPEATALSMPAKLTLLLWVWGTGARVQLALRRRPLHEVVATLEQPTARDRLPVALLNRAISRGLRVGRWQPRCLTRSLVLYRLLRAQGDVPELVIGLRDQPTSHDAHAWIELDGHDVGPFPGGRGYRELSRYPRAADGRRPAPASAR
jgi:hypothetical protein